MIAGVVLVWGVGLCCQRKAALAHAAHGESKVVDVADGAVLACIVELNVNRVGGLFFSADVQCEKCAEREIGERKREGEKREEEKREKRGKMENERRGLCVESCPNLVMTPTLFQARKRLDCSMGVAAGWKGGCS